MIFGGLGAVLNLIAFKIKNLNQNKSKLKKLSHIITWASMLFGKIKGRVKRRRLRRAKSVKD